MQIYQFDLNFTWMRDTYFEAELQGICYCHLLKSLNLFYLFYYTFHFF